MNRWPDLRYAELEHFPLVAQQRGPMPVLSPSCATLNEGWKKSIHALLKIRDMGDDWDGQGTPVPPTDVVDSATILAVMLRQHGVRPPTITVQGMSGDVGFDWQWPDRSTLVLDVTQPYEADVTWYSANGEVTVTALFDPVSYTESG